MRKSYISKILIIALVCTLLFPACNRNKMIIPPAKFAKFITAFTGGQISIDGKIRIELAHALSNVEINSEADPKLFDFSPSIKGKAYWVGNNVVEFVPEAGELDRGKIYHAEFQLGKVAKVSEDMENFEFSFQVVEQNFAIENEIYTSMSSSDSKLGKVEGNIRFNDKIDIEKVKAMLTAELPGVGTLPVKVSATEEDKVFRYTIENIQRQSEDRTLIIKANGKSIQVDKIAVDSTLIPEAGVFKLLMAHCVTLPEPCVELVFSDPLQTQQDIKSAVDILNIEDYVYQIEKNKVRIFFEFRDRKDVTLSIFSHLKNSGGKTLGKDRSITVTLETANPKVEIPYSGTILPDSKNLALPFKTINLWAVDLQIIQIYENNVLRFMQDNPLDGSDQLKRSARLVYKKTLRLDGDASKNLSKWSNFSIDLSKIMKQEPGAIYRVKLSFKKEYSLYRCDGKIPEKLNNEALAALSPEEITEDEMAAWDYSSNYEYYGYDEYEGSEEYNWEDREDPCKASYYMNSENTSAFCNVYGSNLGVIAKGNSDNKLWVTVNNILDTKPVDGATLKVYNYQLQVVGTGKTDKDGFAVIETKNGKPFILTAEQGKDKAYLRLANGEEKSLSRFDVSGKEINRGLKGFLYGERGVWRPGDTIFLSFILQNKDNKIPEGHPVTLEVYNPKGQFYTKQTLTKGLNGFYCYKIKTRSDDPTGLWNAYVKVGGSTFHKSLRIETIKPNRLKINLEIPTDKIEAWQPNVQAKLHANWLTGATAQNLKATVEMTLSRVYQPFKGYEKYTFNSPGTSFSTEMTELFNGKLDASGDVKFTINAPESENAPGLLKANIVTRVFEPGGDASISTQSVPFSPFKSYVGINFNTKNDNEFLETDKNLTFDVVTLNSDGKSVNVQDLEYKIYKLSWSWWWQSNNESFDSYINGTSVKAIGSGKLNTSGGKAKINFRVDYPDWGRYLVYVKNTESGHAAGRIIYVDWPSWRGRAMKDDPSGLTMLSFSTDKPSYEVGETVTVMIPASAGGRALVALENGSSVLKREWITVADKADTKYSFVVTEDMAPNFYIHISLLQPHAQTINNLPIRMYGVVPVRVSNKNSELFPQISMPDVLRPETGFTVKVNEKTGRAMTYTLAIVDEGLLDITNFKTPNPWPEFYAREALGIKTWDLYDYVIGAFGGKFAPLLGIGGDEELSPSKAKANRFKPVVRFLGPFAIKAGETGSHNIKLPPYVGSVRVMVVAGQDIAYGKTEKTVPVRSPLMLLSTLPRVVSVGEEIKLPVTIFAMEESVKDVSVKVTTKGLLDPTGSNPQSIQFKKTGDGMLTFGLKAGSVTGIETVTITATGNGHTASETIEIEVRNPNPAITSFTNKFLATQQEANIPYKLLSQSDENWVKLEVSRIPSVDLSRRLDYLQNYSHCCTEQLTSRAFPLLYIENLKSMQPNELEQLKSSVREAIKNLYGRQLANGGFAYWPGQNYVNDWVTSYAGHFLCEAKQKGYEVNADVLKKWQKYQAKVAKDWRYGKDEKSIRYSYSQSDLEAAYRLYTLALSGAGEQSLMNRMKENTTLSIQAKWRLAAAYTLSGNKKVANELIYNVSNVIDNYSANNTTFGSSIRDNAMILETYLLLDDIPKAFMQAKVVSDGLNREYYFSTQSSAYGLLAMGKLAQKISKGMVEFEWEVDGKPQKAVQTASALYQIEVPTKALTGNIKIKNKGKGDLFVTLTTKTKPVVDDLPELANNLRISISYTDLKGKAIDITKLTQGTDFLANVSITNTSTNTYFADLALTHIIPAGWEIFNQRIYEETIDASAPKNNGYFTYQDIRDDRVLTYFDLSSNRKTTFTIRLQAAYIGKYILPAILCEGMYDTQAQARTTSRWVEVMK